MWVGFSRTCMLMTAACNGRSDITANERLCRATKSCFGLSLMNANLIFLVHACCTLYLCGLIWMVQCVHYKLMDRVGAETFRQYEEDHNRLITPIVAPPMLLELATACLLVAGYGPPAVSRTAAIVGLFAVALIWLSTFLLQVPAHTQLLSGFDDAAYRRLVSTNWLRTGLWTARGFLVAYWLWRALQGTAVSSLES
jgi:hypothetical protein